MLLLLSMTVAFGAELHAGIDPGTVPLLGEPVYVTPISGWSAPIEEESGGQVRVFVTRSAADASERWDAELAQRPPVRSRVPFGDAMMIGDGWTWALVRDGNLVLRLERPGGEVLDLAQRLLGAIVDDVAWPAAPRVTLVGTTVRAEGPWVYARFTAPPRLDRHTYLPTPVTIVPSGPLEATVPVGTPKVRAVAWDRFGRDSTGEWVSVP